jgi:hypothetical protein
MSLHLHMKRQLVERLSQLDLEALCQQRHLRVLALESRPDHAGLREDLAVCDAIGIYFYGPRFQAYIPPEAL